MKLPSPRLRRSSSPKPRHKKKEFHVESYHTICVGNCNDFSTKIGGSQAHHWIRFVANFSIALIGLITNNLFYFEFCIFLELLFAYQCKIIHFSAFLLCYFSLESSIVDLFNNCENTFLPTGSLAQLHKHVSKLLDSSIGSFVYDRFKVHSTF